MKGFASLLALVALLALAGCGGGEETPYLAVEGGGFTFNYRIAEVRYGIVMRPMKALPEGASLEARFEDPKGGPEIVAAARPRPGQQRIMLESPAVLGVVKDRPYKVAVALKDSTGATIETHERDFRSNLDGGVMPEKPLSVGPGYQKNVTGTPDAFPN